jgi:DNA-binding MarR family transcriptional regulator
MEETVSEFSVALDPGNPRSNDDWEIRFGFLLHDCARLRRILIDETFKPLNVTRSQAWLLAYLSRRDGSTQSELADQMNLGKVAVGGLVDRLEASGMIERRAHPSDRRVNNIFLTEKGRKVVTQIRKLTLDANKDMLKGLSMKDLKTVVSVMQTFKRNLQALQ